MTTAGSGAQFRETVRRIFIAVAALRLVFAARHGEAFAVLARQAIVDQAWDDAVLRLIRSRFPQASDDDLRESRAYAYGGSHVADLGYFPLGNRLFSELLHYVRAGDFVGRRDIESLEPRITADRFLFTLPRVDFEKEFGKTYREPGYFAKFFALFGDWMPNVGPLKRLPYKPLPDEVKRLYSDAFEEAEEKYRAALAGIGRDTLPLPNVDLDTGRPSRAGEYAIADTTYSQLMRQLSHDHFANIPPALAADLRAHFRDRDVALAAETCARDRRKTNEALDELDATTGRVAR